jgi:putative serine protease PepD
MNQTTRLSAPGSLGPRPMVLRLAGALALCATLLFAACNTGSNTSPGASRSAAPPLASPAIAQALQNDFVNVVSHVSPSVVVIQTASGLGSGIVFDDKGDIVTNDHVVSGSARFTVTLADGQKLAGKLVGAYPAGDLAVIQVTGRNLKPATFGDSSKLAVGDIVLAVGNPLALQGSVTQGIVSALGRSVPESRTVTLPDVIQTSAEINPGNSGGALVNLAGNVVGIPTLTALDPEFRDTPAAGIGFAISSSMAVDVAGQLIAHGKVVTPPSVPSASLGLPALSDPTAS